MQAPITNDSAAPLDISRAVARGSLTERPLPRLIAQLYRKRVTGCLQIVDDADEESRVYLRDGAPVHVVRPNEMDRLDRVLVESGAVPARAVSEALEAKKQTGKRLGAILIERGLLVDASLANALNLQMRRKLTRLFFAQVGQFAIFTDAHGYGDGADFSPMRIDPRCLLYLGIRAAYDGKRLQEELGPLAGQGFRLIPQSHSFIEAMGVCAQDAVIVALQTRTLCLEDLTALGAKLAETRAAVLALFYADLLETVALQGEALDDLELPDLPTGTRPSRPVASSPAAVTSDAPPVPFTPPPPTVSAPAPRAAPVFDPALRTRIEDLFGRMDKLSHFELLGVEPSAAAEAVNAAYMLALRQFHPDRLLGAGQGELAKQAERVLARMSEASTVLADPKKRAQYVEGRAGKAAVPDPAWVILEAEQTFKTGEDFLKKGDFARAETAFATAKEKNPEEPEYRAYWAWARFENPTAAKGTLARDTLAALEDVLKTKPQFALALFWIGQVWKFLGEIPKAEKAFRDASALDANFIEAQREIRLIVMRRERAAKSGGPRTPESARTSNGLLGKIFKR